MQRRVHWRTNFQRVLTRPPKVFVLVDGVGNAKGALRLGPACHCHAEAFSEFRQAVQTLRCTVARLRRSRRLARRCRLAAAAQDVDRTESCEVLFLSWAAT